jgi:copper chaperone
MHPSRSIRILAGLVVAALAISPAAFAGESEQATLNVKLSVRGMTCSGCVNGVKGALEKVPGVTKAEVSLEKNEAAVTYEKGKTTPEELVKAVEKAGYKCSVAAEKAGKEAEAAKS